MRAASKRQMTLLRDLASQTGETFTYPHDAADASSQIFRLLEVRRKSRRTRRGEAHRLSL